MATKTYGSADVDYGDDAYSYIGGLMADRWWVNDDADNAWENANNWSTAEGGAGGAGIPTATEDVKFSDTSSSAACNMSAASFCKSMAMASGDTGGTDNWSGLLTDNSNTVTASGSILIPNISSLLTSTGKWILANTGNLSNPDESNSINHLEVSSGITGTRTGIVRLRKLTLKSNAEIVGNYFLYIAIPTGDNPLVQESGSDISGGNVFIRTNININQGAIDISDSLSFTGYTTTVTMTGNIDTNGNVFEVRSSSADTDPMIVDMNGNSLVCGAIRLGYSDVGSPGKSTGRIIFGSANHVISDYIRAWGQYTHVYWVFGSGQVSIGGDIDFRYSTVTKGTSTIIQNGSSGNPVINYAGNALANFSVNNAGVSSFIAQDAGIFDTFTATAGKYADGGFLHTVNGHLVIANVASMLTSTGIWLQNATGNIENPHFTNAFKEIQFSAGITATLTTDIWAFKINIGNCTVNADTASDVISIIADANDFWTQHTSAIINSAARISVLGASISLANIILVQDGLIIDCASGSANATLIQTADITCTNLKLTGGGVGFWAALDLNSGAVLIANNVYLGEPLADTRAGRIAFGTATAHVISGDLKRNTSSISTLNEIALETAKISLGGTFDGTGITVTGNGAVITGGTIQNVVANKADAINGKASTSGGGNLGVVFVDILQPSLMSF